MADHLDRERQKLATVGRSDGGGCSCGCCGPSEQDTRNREEEIAELLEARKAISERLAELNTR